MWQVFRHNPKAAIIAVSMHIGILAFMLIGVDWLVRPQQSKSNVEVVKARVLDAGKVAAEVEKLKKAAEEKRKIQEENKRKEEKQITDLKKQQAEEKSRLAKLEKKRKDEQKRLEKEKKQRQIAEKKRKEAEAKRKQAEKKRAEADAKAKAAQQRKAKEAQIAAEEAERNAGEIGRYTDLIKQKTERNWVRPIDTAHGLHCRVQVRLALGGVVIDASIVQSSGSEAFDRSAIAAVYKADPLPVPSGRLFESFRKLNFEFNPDKDN
jgi:colicin import membrane protein